MLADARPDASNRMLKGSVAMNVDRRMPMFLLVGAGSFERLGVWLQALATKP